jgi:hypothetical protein
MDKVDTVSVIAAIFRLYGSHNKHMSDGDIDLAVGEATRIVERADAFLKLTPDEREKVLKSATKGKPVGKADMPTNKILLEDA